MDWMQVGGGGIFSCGWGLKSSPLPGYIQPARLPAGPGTSFYSSAASRDLGLDDLPFLQPGVPTGNLEKIVEANVHLRTVAILSQMELI
jgi:hypothetical protein